MTLVAAALSEHPLAAHAVGEVAGHLLDVGGRRPDVLGVFLTEPFLGAVEDIAGALRHLLEPAALIGAGAASVIGRDREVDGHPSIAAFAIWVGGLGVRAVRLDTTSLTEGSTPGGPGLPDDSTGTLLLLADPFTFPAQGLLERLTQRCPELVVVGASSSTARRPGAGRLVLDDGIHRSGAVALHIDASLPVEVVVIRGCSPGDVEDGARPDGQAGVPGASFDGSAAGGAICFSDISRASSHAGAGCGDAGFVSSLVAPAGVAGMFGAATFGSVAGRARVHDGALTLLLVDPVDV